MLIYPLFENWLLANKIAERKNKKSSAEDEKNFLVKINKLTPNVNNRFDYSYPKRKNFKVLNETKKIHLQKKDFTREKLVEFSLLFIMIFYGGAITKIIDRLAKITFNDTENESLKKTLIDTIKSGKSDKEIENAAIEVNSSLVKNVLENSNLRIIIFKKNYEQIKELFEDLTNDLIEMHNKKKIESLEKKLINNMEEKAYTELLKLKSQINRE